MKKIMRFYANGYSNVVTYKKNGSISNSRKANAKEKKMFLNAYYYNLFERLNKARKYGDRAGGRLGVHGVFTSIDHKFVQLLKKDMHSFYKSGYQNFRRIERPYKITIIARPYHGYGRGSFLAKKEFDDPKKAFEFLKTYGFFKDLWENSDLKKLWYQPIGNFVYTFDIETNIFIKNVKTKKIVKYYPMEDKIA